MSASSGPAVYPVAAVLLVDLYDYPVPPPRTRSSPFCKVESLCTHCGDPVTPLVASVSQSSSPIWSNQRPVRLDRLADDLSSHQSL